jgi:hypothetical protein
LQPFAENRTAVLGQANQPGLALYRVGAAAKAEQVASLASLMSPSPTSGRPALYTGAVPPAGRQVRRVP